MLIASIISALVITACKCNSDNQQVAEPVVEDVTLVVENTVSMDKEAMFLNYSTDYRWYETCIVMQDYLDEETDGTIAGVSNVFQVVRNREDNSYDTEVVLFAHTRNTNSEEVKIGLWVGDFPLNNEEINLTFAEAFEKVMETNYPKPHSRNCVLRREVGPTPNVAPQYIFGNQRYQIYVDAKTGNVTDSNPAFGGLNLGTPLGEWP